MSLAGGSQRAGVGVENVGAGTVVRTGAVVGRLAFLLPVGDRAVQVEVRPLGVVQK